jgi:hypothetical protein
VGLTSSHKLLAGLCSCLETARQARPQLQQACRLRVHRRCSARTLMGSELRAVPRSRAAPPPRSVTRRLPFFSSAAERDRKPSRSPGAAVALALTPSSALCRAAGLSADSDCARQHWPCARCLAGLETSDMVLHAVQARLRRADSPRLQRECWSGQGGCLC